MKSFAQIGEALGMTGKQAYNAYQTGMASLKRRLPLGPELLEELENEIAAEALKNGRDNGNVTTSPDRDVLGVPDSDLRGSLHVSGDGRVSFAGRDIGSLSTAPGSIFRQCA